MAAMTAKRPRSGAAAVAAVATVEAAAEGDNDLDHDDEEGLTAEEDRLFTAISFGKLHKVTSLLPHIRNTEVRDEFRSTPLLHSARHARDEHVNFLVKLLLQRGSDVNAQDDAGMTSLMHLSCRPGSSGVDAIRTVMRCRRCEPEMRDSQGNTALMHAAKFGNAEALAILLFLPAAAKRADVNARNGEGLAALDFAVMEGHARCCRMLVEEAEADTEAVKDAVKLTELLSVPDVVLSKGDSL